MATCQPFTEPNMFQAHVGMRRSLKLDGGNRSVLAENFTIESHSESPEEYTVHVVRADSVREGVVDVLSMRGLVRAYRAAMGRSRDDDFERALAKIINVNGAIAQAVEIERHRREATPNNNES